MKEWSLGLNRIDNFLLGALRSLRAALRRRVYGGDDLQAGPRWIISLLVGARRAEAQVLVVAKSVIMGLPHAKLNRIVALPRADCRTVFIVGSGPSANNLTAEQKVTISNGFSIALNDATVPDISFDLRLFEQLRTRGPRRSGPEDRAVYDPPATLRLFHVTQPLGAASDSGLMPPSLLDNRSIIYSSTNFLTGNSRIAAQLFVESANRSRCLTPSVAMGSQASLLRALWIGIHLRFPEIVLVGIDLGRTNAKGEVIEKHETATKQNATHIPVDELLSEIAKETRFRGTPEIYLGSRSGLLSSVFPLFDWQ